jgi:hypothetical protein
MFLLSVGSLSTDFTLWPYTEIFINKLAFYPEDIWLEKQRGRLFLSSWRIKPSNIFGQIHFPIMISSSYPPLMLPNTGS